MNQAFMMNPSITLPRNFSQLIFFGGKLSPTLFCTPFHHGRSHAQDRNRKQVQLSLLAPTTHSFIALGKSFHLLGPQFPNPGSKGNVMTSQGSGKVRQRAAPGLWALQVGQQPYGGGLSTTSDLCCQGSEFFRLYACFLDCIHLSLERGEERERNLNARQQIVSFSYTLDLGRNQQPRHVP